MARKHKVKSCKYIKIMLKTGSDTENKPKYTKYIQNSKPESKRKRGDAPSTGWWIFCVYLKCKKRAIKATKWKDNTNKRKSTSNTWYFTYLSHESSIKRANNIDQSRKPLHIN